MSILFYFFSLLGRSSLSLFPYTAAGGTDSRLTPPSGSGESAQDRKRRRNRGRILLSMRENFWGGVQWMQTLKADSASAEFHLVLKGFNNERWWPHARGEWQVFVVFSLPYWSNFFFIHHIHFYFPLQTIGLSPNRIYTQWKSEWGNVSPAGVLRVVGF